MNEPTPETAQSETLLPCPNPECRSEDGGRNYAELQMVFCVNCLITLQPTVWQALSLAVQERNELQKECERRTELADVLHTERDELESKYNELRELVDIVRTATDEDEQDTALHRLLNKSQQLAEEKEGCLIRKS